MSTRQEPSLPDPPTTRDAKGFPEEELATRTGLARVCLSEHGPWWFCSGMDCRFDLQAPDGTCHLATEAAVAFLEVIGPGYRDGIVSRAFIDARVLYYPLFVPTPQRLADPTVRAAHDWGVTAELSTVPYSRSQKWAKWFNEGGFDGLWYRSRHDPSAARSCVALFHSPGGELDWYYRWPDVIDDDLLEELSREFTIAVEDVPRSDQLTQEP